MQARLPELWMAKPLNAHSLSLRAEAVRRLQERIQSEVKYFS